MYLMSTRKYRSAKIRLIGASLLALLLGTSAQADPVWHCSRTSLQVADAGDNFSLAALDAEREVLRISLRDLYAIYQGNQVKASGVTLSACFIGGNNAITKSAMSSIGAEPHVLEKLSRKTALVSQNIYMVQSEQDMQSCMTKHHPAIGYLSKATHTEAIGPCF